MHGINETTRLPRTVWTVAHLGLLGLAGWLLLAGGVETVGFWVRQDWQPGNLSRRYLLFGCGVVLWSRMAFTSFFLLKRKFSWSECIPVIGACAMYQLGYAVLGATNSSPIDWLDGVAIALFLFGSGINTGSEWQRSHFKKSLHSIGKLYTRGLFSIVRHPNYLGDILWATGWAILTRNFWSSVIPIICAAFFIFMFIPQLSKYLAERYGEQYLEWEKRTKKIFPLIYRLNSAKLFKRQTARNKFRFLIM